MNAYAVGGFLLAVFPLIATPGASLTLLTQKVVPHGATGCIPVILGTASGLYVHATLAAAGLSAVVMRSAELFTALRLAGAVYLIGLGLWTVRSGFVKRTNNQHSQFRIWHLGSTFGQAMLANVLNPKAASIFLTLVPQFVDPAQPVARQILILATAQTMLVTVWLLGWTIIIGRAGRAFRSPSFTSAVRRITGTVLVGLGIRTVIVAAASR